MRRTRYVVLAGFVIGPAFAAPVPGHARPAGQTASAQVESVRFEAVAALGGQFRGLAADGDYLYTLRGTVLEVYDARWKQVVAMGGFKTVDRVMSVGSSVLVLSDGVVGSDPWSPDSLGLILVDVSSPSRPRVLSRVAVPGEIRDVAVWRDRVFVTHRASDHIAVVDIGDPTSPRVLAPVQMPAMARSLAAGDTRLFVALPDTSRVAIVDLAAVPFTVTAVAELIIDNRCDAYINDIAAAGDNFVAAVTDWNLEAIDVSDLSAPQVAIRAVLPHEGITCGGHSGTVHRSAFSAAPPAPPPPEFTSVVATSFDGVTEVWAGGTGSYGPAQVVHVAGSGQPTWAPVWAVGGMVAFHRGVAIQAASRGLLWADGSGTSNPVPTLGTATGFAPASDGFWVADHDGEIWRIAANGRGADGADGAELVLSLGDVGLGDIVTTGDHLVVIENRGRGLYGGRVRVMAVAGGSLSPTALWEMTGSYAIADFPRLEAYGAGFLVSLVGGGFAHVDLSTAAVPTLVDSHLVDSWAAVVSMTSADGRVYEVHHDASTGRSLNVFAIDPTGIITPGVTVPSDGIADVVAAGDVLVSAGFEAGLGIYDTSNPDQPVEVARLDDATYHYGSEHVAFLDDLLIAVHRDRVEAVDLSERTAPRVAAEVRFAHGGELVAVSGTTIALGSYDSIVRLFNLVRSNGPAQRTVIYLPAMHRR